MSSNCGSLCKALLSGRMCAGFRVVFAVGTGPLPQSGLFGTDDAGAVEPAMPKMQ